jgi:hypothetical protein
MRELAAMLLDGRSQRRNSREMRSSYEKALALTQEKPGRQFL